MRCRACGAVVGANARFCEQCGTRLLATDGSGPSADPRMGARPTTRKPGRSFASSQAMASAPSDNGHEARDPSATGSSGDRRIVTALFADLVDYVRLVAEHDPEEVRRRVDAALVAMVDAIQGFDGTREKFIGDAVFAVFGWPVAHDDDALRATHCALAIRAGLARLEDPSGEVLQVRIGIATGEVVAAPRDVPGAQDWSLTGPAVTTAARIQGVAEPGEILLDEATIRAARKGLAIEDLGERAAARPDPAGPDRAAARRGGVPAVAAAVGPVRRPGRRAGRDPRGPGRPSRPRPRRDGPRRRRGRDRQVPADGRASTPTPGARASPGPGSTTCRTARPSRTGSPGPWPRSSPRSTAADSGTVTRRLLFSDDVDPVDVRRWAGGDRGDRPRCRVLRLGGGGGPRPVRSGRRRPRPAVGRRPLHRAADRARRPAGHRRRRPPLARPVERRDLRGAGPAVGRGCRSSSWSAAGPIAAGRIRLATTSGRSTLEGLDEAETGELARAVAGATVDAADVRRLYARTGGNPLFIGETVRAIVDEGAITSDGRLAIGDSAGADVPVTLRALLGSRIDALSVETRTVLRVGAVLGMSFREATVEGVLDEPVDAVGLRAAGRGGDDRPARRRRRLAVLPPADPRRRVPEPARDGPADAPHAGRRSDRGGRPAGAVGVIARHRAAAGDAERAIPLLVRAAEQAEVLGAGAEAAAYFTAAADLTVGSASEALRARASEAHGGSLVGGR